MTNESLYQVLEDISENHVKEAGEYCKTRKPVWLKWGVMAACLCFAVFGIFAVQYLGGTPGAVIEQSPSSDLVVNEVDDVVRVDMDVQISHYTGISADEWETVMEAFEQAAGMSYEEFIKRLPASYQRTAFYSIDAPAVPRSGEYIPHDYVFEFLTENGGEVKIAICADEEPLRDCFFMCEDPKASKINGVTALIYRIQDRFMVQFSYDTVNYDIDTRNLSLEEVENLLSCMIGQ